MQSENFDKKIRDSLSQRPPGNDDPAWDKMEPLLDKHMPQEKKDRRKIFFILFLFLLTGGGAFLIWQNNKEDKNNISAIESQNKNSGSEKNNKSPATTPDANTSNIQPESISEQKPGDTNDQIILKTQEIKNPNANGSTPQAISDPEFPISDLSATKTKQNKLNNGLIAGHNKPLEKQIVNEEKLKPVEDIAAKENNPVIADKQMQRKEPELQKTNTDNKNLDQKQETKGSQSITTEKSSTTKQRNKTSIFDNLFFSVSAGADLSTVGIDNLGKVKPVYGAGLGYKISNKFSIRTGFYSARKIYTADPDDYHPSYNLAAYYPNLKNIEANCKVYEIPLTIDYTISRNKKQSWFASAGVSTLIMKKETYDYYYKPNNSPTYVTYTRTINDQNKHYFSVLNLSGGYSRNINKNLSLQAEPYMKIAMSGIGFGKVNLNSGGVLFSAVIRPFAKK